MSNETAPEPTPTHDRREFLRRAGLGAAAAGAWVAPQVLFTSTASAGCTPITKVLQISACSGLAGVTSTDSNIPGCIPPNWAVSRNDGVTFLYGGGCNGGTVTITNGCTPVAGRAVKWCVNGSQREKYTCVTGTVSGNQVIFPALTTGELNQGCIYVDYRITVSCCT